MVDHADEVGMCDRQGVCNGPGAIPRTVIDRDDLKRGSDGRERLESLGHERPQVRLFVRMSSENRTTVMA